MPTVRHDEAGILLRASFAIVSAMLVLSANTLIGRAGGNLRTIRLILFAVIIATIALLWMDERIARPKLGRLILWSSFALAIYLLVAIANDDWGGAGTAFFFLLLALLPLYLQLLVSRRLFAILAKTYVEVMSILAISSLLLWLLGPVAGIIRPNCSITTTWGIGLGKSLPGYFHLLYEVHSSDLYGTVLVRNTSIFVEAPMYSYSLSLAMLAEVYGGNKPRRTIVLLLSLAILSSISATGILFLLMIAYLNLSSLGTTKRTRNALRAVLSVALAIALVTAIMSLLDRKIVNVSENVRLDDYIAGFKAWARSPLVGNGFTNYEAAQAYMGAFRSDILGSSNSLARVFSTGGLAFASLYAYAFYGLFHSPCGGFAPAGLYIFLWAVTIVPILPVTAFMCGIGVCCLINYSSDQGVGFDQTFASRTFR